MTGSLHDIQRPIAQGLLADHREKYIAHSTGRLGFCCERHLEQQRRLAFDLAKLGHELLNDLGFRTSRYGLGGIVMIGAT